MADVADVKELLGKRKIPDEEIIESLRYNDYDIDMTASYLAKKFDKEQAAKSQKAAAAAAKKAEEAKKKEQAAKAKLESDLAKLDINKPAKPTALKNVPLPSLKPTLDLEKEIKEVKLKPKINFVVIGHVDAGKSTLMGRLLYDVEAVDKRLIEQYKRESQNAGKGSFHLAWVLDQTEEERQRGVTMDICMRSFETKTTRFTILDAPGHRDFVPNMIAGSAQADIAVLVVDSSTGAFESGFFLDGQTREHAILVRSMGVTHLIVAINKLDIAESRSEREAEARYYEIKSHLEPFFEKIGFNAKDVSYVPCSGYNGANVVKLHKHELAWYDGPTLLALLESKKITEKDDSGPFRITISDSFSPAHSSAVHMTGRIETGAIQVGDTAVVVPKNLVLKIKSLKVNDAPCAWAKAGEIIEASVVGCDSPEDLFPSDILCPPTALVPVVQKFRATFVAFELTRPILKGARVMFHRGRINTPATITKMIALVSKADGSVIKEKPRLITSSQAALVEITLDEGPLPMELFKDSKELGRAILRQGGSTIGVCVVDSLIYPKKKASSD